MAFEDELKEFSKTIPQKLEHIDSEETSKIALITPFLRLMGYDTSDPSEVRAEYTADLGTKQGEKVDFAILENGHPIIFIECKSATNDLTLDNISQLYRYFSITDIQIGILTNGLDYKFFTTGEDNSRMDEKPFLEVNMLNLSKKDIKELEKFKKVNFDIDEVVSRADNLKYRNLIKKTLLLEFENPSDEFVRVIGKQFYDGVLTQNIKENFAGIIPTVISEIINEKINKTLSDAVASNEEEQEEVEDKIEDNNNGIVTTDLEREAYFIVMSIASEVTEPKRIAIRDRKSYCNILFDDNNRFPIVRLHFNNDDHLRVEFYDSVTVSDSGTKKGDRLDIESVTDLYNYKERILNIVNEYLAM